MDSCCADPGAHRRALALQPRMDATRRDLRGPDARLLARRLRLSSVRRDSRGRDSPGEWSVASPQVDCAAALAAGGVVNPRTQQAIEGGNAVKSVVMQDLNVGDWAVFDPVYGRERLQAISRFTLGKPEFGMGGGGVKVLHLQVTDERSTTYARFIVRAVNEPVVVVPLSRSDANARGQR